MKGGRPRRAAANFALLPGRGRTGPASRPASMIFTQEA